MYHNPVHSWVFVFFVLLSTNLTPNLHESKKKKAYLQTYAIKNKRSARIPKYEIFNLRHDHNGFEVPELPCQRLSLNPASLAAVPTAHANDTIHTHNRFLLHGLPCW